MILLRTSVISTILIILVLCLRMFLKDVLSKQSILVFWYTVILRSLLVLNISFMPKSISNSISGTVDKISKSAYFDYVGLVENTGNSIANAIHGLEAVWVCGFLVFSIFQVVIYAIYIYRFSKSVIIRNEHIERWQSLYCKKSVLVKCSDYIHTPLTYGIIRPVILIPSSMNLNDTKKLRYIFLHEYTHICHRDTLLKVLLLLSISIHWYNPMIWLMYRVVNSDIEYACDESVIKMIGDSNKKNYATLLVDMAEDNLSKFDLCNHLSNCILEKRIMKIMKGKKWSVIAKPLTYLVAVVLVIVTVISMEHRTILADDRMLLNSSEIENAGQKNSSEIRINTEELNENQTTDLLKGVKNSEGQMYNYEREMSEKLGDSQQEIIAEIYDKTGVKVTPLYGNAYIKSEEDFLGD